MNERAARGHSHDTSYAPRYPETVHAAATAPPTLAEQARDAASSLEREVHALERAIAMVSNAYAANDPRQWQEVRGSLDRQIAAATRAHERTRAFTSDTAPEVAETLASAVAALSEHVRTAEALVEPPSGFRAVANEDAILATLTRATEGGAHLGFARKEAELEQHFDALTPADRSVLARRLNEQRGSDPVASAFSTRLTHERQQRLRAHLASAAKREAMQRERGASMMGGGAEPKERKEIIPTPEVPPLPEPESLDTQMRRVLELGSGSLVAPQLATVFAALDDSTRRELARRLETYRPGNGDDVAARFARLDRPIQSDLLGTLRRNFRVTPSSCGDAPCPTVADGAQRFGADAPPVPVVSVGNADVKAAVASLAAAEYEFDTGWAELQQSSKAEDGVIGTNQLQRMEYHWRTGLAHLIYGRERITATSNDPDAATIKTQMEETSQALEAYRDASLHSGDADRIAPILDGVLPTHAALRVSLGLAETSAARDRRRETKADDHYESGVVGPALELARLKAERLYASLADEPDAENDRAASDAAVADREGRIRAGATAVEPHLRYALSMIGKLEERNRSAHASKIEAVSMAIYKVVKWTRGRPGSALLEGAVNPTVSLVDRARHYVGLQRLDDQPAPALAGREEKEEGSEREKLGAASNDLRNAYDALKDKALSSLKYFEDMTGIKEVEPPPFLAELGKAILIAALGHLTGGIGAVVLGNVARTFGKGLGASRVIAAMREVTVDATQGIAGKVADDAFKGTDQEAARARLFAGFMRGMRDHAVDSATSSKAAINKLMADQRVTNAELVAMWAAVKASEDDAHAIVLQSAARGWATALAQTRLGVDVTTDKSGAPTGSTTKMAAYFGSMEHTRPEHAWVERKDSKWGTVDGVLRIDVMIDDDESAAAPRVQVRSADARGLERDMCLAMVMNGKADFKPLKEIAAVKEISVWRGTRNGRLAIDEHGTIRDAFRWDVLRRWIPDSADRAPEARFYEEPESCWRLLGEMKLSAGLIK